MEMEDPKLHYARARIAERSDSQENNPEICSPNMIPRQFQFTPSRYMFCQDRENTYVHMYKISEVGSLTRHMAFMCWHCPIIDTWLKLHGLL